MKKSPTLLRRCTNEFIRTNFKRRFASLHTLGTAPSFDTISATMNSARHTRILPVDPTQLGRVTLRSSSDFLLDDWEIELRENESVANLQSAAAQLRDSDNPVAFPTETVYGLGADATRSDAVRGIYKAKQRPSDNPLIVHFASLRQLKDLLGDSPDVIPAIYKPVIQRFWPGPLTIILPNPKHSPLAPEVTAGLSTFGARIPRNLLALLLIKMAGVPIAAPSANASTKPSPTAAEHVKFDLDGRIDFILDGGPCDVGMESTVIDGLSDPPAILRPGGISMEQLRTCAGWENVAAGYKDAAEQNGAPRAPGMKYRHYSPSALVVLHEAKTASPTWDDFAKYATDRIGFVRTKTWSSIAFGIPEHEVSNDAATDCHILSPSVLLQQENGKPAPLEHGRTSEGLVNILQSFVPKPVPRAVRYESSHTSGKPLEIWDINLGPNTDDIARGLFSALRELDRKNVDVIYVEGIADEEGDVAVAVMNRLRKAAEIKVK
jgi:L-threonylcarbamoyladenylate synthase